jgi:hypothetical protein
MEKCEHKRTVFIFESRLQNMTQETSCAWWQDVIIGVKCLDCGEQMKTPEFPINKDFYSGTPNYPPKAEEKSEKIKPLSEFNC